MNWIAFSPELYFLLTAMVFLCLSLTGPVDPRKTFYAALILAAGGVGVCVATVGLSGDLFMQTYRVDLFSQVFKAILAMGYFLVVCLCIHLEGVAARRHPEFYLLLATSTLAMMILVSSVHLLNIYIALELSSYSLYVLVYFRSGHRSLMATSLRYFLIGATASAIMLFGMALLYSAGGSAFVIDLMKTVHADGLSPVMAIGLLMMLCGFLFKLAVFPFHFWAPDVYEDAVHPLAAYVATVSKVAAIAILIRVVGLMAGGSDFIAHTLVVLSIITMTVGNLSAMVQRDFKRMLAYSSVAHAGYVLIGILSMNAMGYASAAFYAAALLTMKFTCFLVLVMVADNAANLDIRQLAGLHRRSPLLALALMMALFGLAGIPPTIGFSAKLLIFTAAMSKGYFTLVLIAMINVVISLYYYLQVLKAAYLIEPETEPRPLVLPAPIRWLTVVLIILMVVPGIYPTLFIDVAKAAVRFLAM